MFDRSFQEMSFPLGQSGHCGTYKINQEAESSNLFEQEFAFPVRSQQSMCQQTVLARNLLQSICAEHSRSSPVWSVGKDTVHLLVSDPIFVEQSSVHRYRSFRSPQSLP